MAFTRKFLAALGIESDKIDEIMSAHVEVTNGLKDEINNSKVDAEKVTKLEEELSETKKKLENATKDDYKAKYDKLSGEFDAYKKEVSAKETKSNKDSALRTKLKAEGYSEKGIDKILKYGGYHEKIELDEKGEIKDFENLKIADEWSEYKGITNNSPAPNPNPPIDNKGGNTKPQSRAAQIVAQYHDSLYGSTPNKEV